MGARIRTLFAMALAIALMSLATAVPVLSQEEDDDETQSLRVKSVDSKTSEIQVDANDNGEEDEGDYFVGAGPLFRRGDRVGNEKHVCTAVSGNKRAQVSRCEGTFVIKGRGSLEVSGTLKFTRQGPPESNLAIIGGTGQFREAEGTVKFEGTQRSTVFIFKIIT